MKTKAATPVSPDQRSSTAQLLRDELPERIAKWRTLAGRWTDACEEVHDLAEALGDDFPALAWLLADRGHGVGAEFGFALDDLEALLRDTA